MPMYFIQLFFAKTIVESKKSIDCAHSFDIIHRVPFISEFVCNGPRLQLIYFMAQKIKPFPFYPAQFFANHSSKG